MGLFLHQVWRNLAFHHLLSNGSSEVNGCRQSPYAVITLPQVEELSHHCSPNNEQIEGMWGKIYNL